MVTDVGSQSVAHALGIRGDGRIVVTGSMRGGATTDVVVLRYDTGGGLDPSFGPVGTTPAGIVITDTEVPRSALVSATFDGALDSFTLVVVTAKGKAVDGTTTCDAPCTTVTPTRRLPARSTATATVTGTAAGGTTTHSWTFITAKKGGKPT